MAIPMSRLGGRALHSGDDDETEREYDRLRDLARAEAEKRNSCFERSKRAYADGDGAAAKDLSNQGKAHDRKMDEYNEQAAEFIFRANNAPGRVEPDCIDLHGLYVEEAERILEKRIRADQAAGQTHLRAIVGKGNHSTGHVQKIRPKVEELCRELGLRYREEENAGRILINLQGGEPLGPGDHPSGGAHHGAQQAGYPGAHHGGHQQHGGHHHQQQQQQQQQDEVAEAVGRILPRVLRKLEKHCCIVM
ncbi:Smr domain-containing protein C11H11.03c-like protein [Hapsidospora chrysogenum ATCC 11550]|uniref:Smr domain-containing protein C11H11.03c-like protein n=1 Tax=Hapsidospora chrysogenum (strain ATCC 11550 / CBS 779.69 / DSM 880 / IAM 14645 / JCM 23072 / IMI 49137) TaxID=857340 RepID=A0A086SVW7_HAPC1|nr:Smr domain-containing protein C11H11.03c-like protein [Hapsidospora chrysogenum ATCC 11550]